MKKVGNFLIDLDRHLGKGQYGIVYLSHGLPQSLDPSKINANAKDGSNGASITATKLMTQPEFYACKVVERKNLCE